MAKPSKAAFEFSNTFEARLARYPRREAVSLIEIGTPSSKPLVSPAASRRSDAAACDRARSCIRST